MKFPNAMWTAALMATVASLTMAVVECPAGECWTGVTGCVPSEPGVVCVECVGSQGYGWINGTECVYETFVLQTLDRVVPVSDCGLRKCNQGGTCVPATVGARCAECSYRGYTALSGEDLTPVCVCYDARYDPKAGCKSLYDDVVTEVSVTDAYESVVCVPWRNKYLGLYEQDTSPFKYGNANPPTPKKCVWPYGPPPFALVENLPPFTSCATLGGADPNEAFGIRKDFSFQTCSGHGTWNVEDHSCVCDAQWQRSLTGEYDVYGGAVMTCDDCADHYGPPPPNHDPQQTPQLPPYCSKIWMEDFDGVRKECSGHGTYAFGTCICDSSTTAGFWNITKIDGTDTCLVCADGYGPERDCRLFDGQTQSPAVDTSEPTPAPTPPPFRSSSCVPCFDRFRGQGTLVGNAWEFAAVPLSIQSVCGACNVTTDGEYVYVSEAECTNTTISLTTLGYEMCDYVRGCTAFEFTLGENGTYAYRFSNTTNYRVVADLDPNSAWSLACVTTSRPTRSPRTAYPTMAPIPVPTTPQPTLEPTTLWPTTLGPTLWPTTLGPTTMGPTTPGPTSSSRPTRAPTPIPIRAPTRFPTGAPTTTGPTTLRPTTPNPTLEPTLQPTTMGPTTMGPTTLQPTIAPTTPGPTLEPTTRTPTTHTPTTNAPTTQPTSRSPTTRPTLP